MGEERGYQAKEQESETVLSLLFAVETEPLPVKDNDKEAHKDSLAHLHLDSHGLTFRYNLIPPIQQLKLVDETFLVAHKVNLVEDFHI